MHSVLMKAVLSSSPDYNLLFDSLCWAGEASCWPETERVEALTALIEGLGPLLSDPDSPGLTDEKKRSVHDKVEWVIWSKCLPFLSRISAEAESDPRCRESTAAACRLLAACVSLSGEDAQKRVVSCVLRSFQPSEEDSSRGHLSVHVATEVLAALMPVLAADDQLMSSTLTSALSSIRRLPDALLVSRVAIRVLLTLLNCCSRGGRTILERIVDDVCGWHSSERGPGATERALLCLTVLSDHLLKPRAPPDPRLSVHFWRVVQDGLTHRDCVSRKRALYLLKRCAALSEEEGVDCPHSASQEGKETHHGSFDLLKRFHNRVSDTSAEEVLFRWTPDKSRLLRDFWEDYVLVMETLEENQVRIRWDVFILFSIS